MDLKSPNPDNIPLLVVPNDFTMIMNERNLKGRAIVGELRYSANGCEKTAIIIAKNVLNTIVIAVAVLIIPII